MTRFDLNFAHIIPFTILAAVVFLCCRFSGDGSVAWGVIAAISGIIFAAPITLLIWFNKKPYSPSGNVVLRKGDKYYDLGPGGFRLGINSWFGNNELTYYNPKTTASEDTLRLQIKDGTFVDVAIVYTWKPDKDNLDEYFAENQTMLLRACVEARMRDWARPLSGKEIFYANPPQVDGLIPGLITGGPRIKSMVAHGSSDMSVHVRDNSVLIESAIAEIQDVVQMGAVREQLILLYPELEHRITKLLRDRGDVLSRRGLNANR